MNEAEAGECRFSPAPVSVEVVIVCGKDSGKERGS